MIYSLEHSLDHVQASDDYDAVQLRFSDDDTVNFYNPELEDQARVPEFIEYIGDLDRLAQTDFPYTDSGLLLMSPKLLLTTLEAGAFPYVLFPTRIYSPQAVDEDMSEEQRWALTDPAVVATQFVIVQLRQWTNVIDLERTIVTQYDARAKRRVEVAATASRDPEFIRADQVTHLALSVQEQDLPGLLRFENMPGLYASEHTKEACQAGGLRGVAFEPVPVPRG